MTDKTGILFIGDIIGPHGLDLVASVLPQLKERREIDLIIANGENATHGRGLDDQTTSGLFEKGIQVITSGNHIWQRTKYFRQLNTNPHVLRPLNYPEECPGHGSCVYTTGKNVKVGIISLQGRSFMYPIDCPFKSADRAIRALKAEGVHNIIVDFHAEATAEKVALGYYLDGKASAVIGTHTHVQTADNRILPKGTAYMTDAGMTGPQQSVIGMNINTAIDRFIQQLPVHYSAASPIDLKLCGAYICINPESGSALSIERLEIGI